MMRPRVFALMLGVPPLASACGKAEPVRIETEGTLATGDAVLQQDGSYYDEYRFRAEAGWTITAVMRSQAFDAYLHLLHDGKQVTSNDDDPSVGRTDAKITHVAAESGEYVVLANSYEGQATGPYRISITALPP
ncbi:MAG: hypothetical protein NZ898_00080 [Myxococcota bacterium]|nr:hypothetical protein [Myxococcota bacterium]MDW8361681.1 hypothetical protein [Myxococcales bacterium]